VDLPREPRLRADPDALGDRRLVVDSDVRGFVSREDVGLGLLYAPLGDGLAVHVHRRLAALAESTAVIGEVEDDCRRAGRQRLRGSDRVALEAEEVVDVGGLPVLHVQRPAAETPALRQDGAVRAAGRDVEFGGDLARAVLDGIGVPFKHLQVLGGSSRVRSWILVSPTRPGADAPEITQRRYGSPRPRM
jgi:hypothetical protein